MDAREHVIVCGVDGSPAGQRAAEWAIDEARRRGCRLRAVTTWSWDGLGNSPQQALAHAQEIQARALNEVLGTAPDPPAIERLVIEGRPSEVLCTAALDAELVVLGSHGHGAVHDALVGSTSQHVIRHAPCPVVVLPDPRHVERELRRSRVRRRPTSPPGPAPMF